MNSLLNGERLRGANMIVLDASAMLATIHGEPGAEKLTPHLRAQSVASAVNAAEVQLKLVLRGAPESEAWKAVQSSVGAVVDFTSEHAMAVGSLIAQTKPLGLSLGDRACIALAISLNATLYTADRSWKQLKLPIRVDVIR